jgi:hypothetical protein
MAMPLKQRQQRQKTSIGLGVLALGGCAAVLGLALTSSPTPNYTEICGGEPDTTTNYNPTAIQAQNACENALQDNADANRAEGKLPNLVSWVVNPFKNSDTKHSFIEGGAFGAVMLFAMSKILDRQSK